MTRPDKPIFRRFEKQYEKSLIQGWYKPDLDRYPAVEQEVWVMSIYDRAWANEALTDREYTVVADNSFLGSFAYNFILPALLLDDPDLTGLCHATLLGNAKLAFAEAELRHAPDNSGRKLLVEYLFETDEANREVLRVVERKDLGPGLITSMR